MVASAIPYGLFQESLLEGRISILTDPLMCMITDSGYTPNQHTHKFRSVVTDEIVGSGYVAGGKEVTGLTTTYTSVGKKITLSGSDLVWPTVTWTGARYLVFYFAPDGIPISAQPLVGYGDLGEDIDRAGEPFYVNWSETGLLTLAFP